MNTGSVPSGMTNQPGGYCYNGVKCPQTWGQNTPEVPSEIYSPVMTGNGMIGCRYRTSGGDVTEGITFFVLFNSTTGERIKWFSEGLITQNAVDPWDKADTCGTVTTTTVVVQPVQQIQAHGGPRHPDRERRKGKYRRPHPYWKDDWDWDDDDEDNYYRYGHWRRSVGEGDLEADDLD